MADDVRLEGRNGAIWQAFLRGHTQEAVAHQHGISQSRVSQIIAEVRASIPTPVIEEIAKTEADRVAALYAETMKILYASHPLVSMQRGEVITDQHGVPFEDAGPKLAAINTALKIHERVARTYGTDAPTKARVEVSQVDGIDAAVRELVARLDRRAEGASP